MPDDVLSGKKIILGVTGGIAAYKACYLVRELIQRGAEVRVVMTPSALEFIAPLTFSSLTGNKVIVNTFPVSQQDGCEVNTWHIDYGTWADLMIIAPATINTIAKIAHGFADNALTTLVTALRCPLIIVPAADVDMYMNPVTQGNINKLQELGHFIIDAEEGELASGLSGKGRLAGNNKIIDAAELVLSGYRKDLKGKKVLVTAGPTFENIDPVRFIGNRSSGKMGYSISKSAFLRGAEVILVSGPSSEFLYPEIQLVKIQSAEEMKKQVDKYFPSCDILIMSAAVADYKPQKLSSSKIKKEDSKLTSIKVTETIDILGSLKKEKQFTAGFALETENELVNAKNKLKNKKLDLIVLNSLKDKKSGFEFDTNKITIFLRNGNPVKYPLMTKFQAANKILNEIIKSL
ncbi:MAG TPA: bifunctional phosphopantothenoylcysteine decarboxylase/phosphopantothenate--cysteine ligase CoaBC [Ignavibacteriaceae bacterium]|nr:bifunctional phosphopantothenoylcysteine decarboxylase/phosphopantothenate--cysteine ligase CoaBC [Ignavibacteriaceae bacterium]